MGGQSPRVRLMTQAPQRGFVPVAMQTNLTVRRAGHAAEAVDAGRLLAVDKVRSGHGCAGTARARIIARRPLQEIRARARLRVEISWLFRGTSALPRIINVLLHLVVATADLLG